MGNPHRSGRDFVDFLPKNPRIYIPVLLSKSEPKAQSEWEPGTTIAPSAGTPLWEQRPAIWSFTASRGARTPMVGTDHSTRLPSAAKETVGVNALAATTAKALVAASSTSLKSEDFRLGAFSRNPERMLFRDLRRSDRTCCYRICSAGRDHTALSALHLGRKL